MLNYEKKILKYVVIPKHAKKLAQINNCLWLMHCYSLKVGLDSWFRDIFPSYLYDRCGINLE